MEMFDNFKDLTNKDIKELEMIQKEIEKEIKSYKEKDTMTLNELRKELKDISPLLKIELIEDHPSDISHRIYINTLCDFYRNTILYFDIHSYNMYLIPIREHQKDIYLECLRIFTKFLQTEPKDRI